MKINTDTTILYLPGFHSAVNKVESSTFKALKDSNKFEDIRYLLYDPHKPKQSLDILFKKVLDIFRNENSDMMLVGHSLGGYFTNILSDNIDIPAVLINPALDPTKNIG